MSGGRAWVCLALLLGACALGPGADRSRFFTLTPIDADGGATTSAAPPHRVLGLGPIVLPAYLGRASMATRIGPNEVRYAELDRWAEPLDRSVARTLQQNLLVLLGTQRIVLYPWPLSAGVDAAVAVELLRFEPTTAKTAELVAHWSVRDARRGGLLVTRESVLREPLEGDDPGAAAAALSRALAALAQEIASAVRNLPRV
jgi:uncharacterized lipoprotein YmbA